MLDADGPKLTLGETIIFKTLRRAGRSGISLSDLIDEFYRGSGDPPLTANHCVRELIYRMRRKGVDVRCEYAGNRTFNYRLVTCSSAASSSLDSRGSSSHLPSCTVPRNQTPCPLTSSLE